jgi:hypothetical protein
MILIAAKEQRTSGETKTLQTNQITATINQSTTTTTTNNATATTRNQQTNHEQRHNHTSNHKYKLLAISVCRPYGEAGQLK